MVQIDDPAVSAVAAEVPLQKAPLVRVIAQVKFPLILSVEKREFIAPFQEAIRETYPRLRQEQIVEVMLGPAGIAHGPSGQKVWRFSDLTDSWRVSLAPNFLALETSAYTSRSDFFSRLDRIVSVLGHSVAPKIVDRIGVRYIDRISGEAVNEIARLIRPEVRGLAGTPASTHLKHQLSESVFIIGNAQLLARWGQLPANATTDPSAIEPHSETSWILDLDMFRESPVGFDPVQLVADARGFAERIYTFFRWAVTDEFLQRYGGAQ